MKKILAFLLGLALTLALLFFSFENPFGTPDPTATPTQSTPTNVPTTPPTQAPTGTAAPTEEPTPPPTTQPVVYDLPTSAIMLTQQAEQSKTSDGGVCFTYLYPNVRLFLGNESVSQAVTLDLLNRIDGTRDQADTVREDALNSGTSGSFYQLQYTPSRIDGAVLSLAGEITSYNGGAHPNSACVSATYDLMTGNSLTLADVLTEACTPEVLCRMVVDVLSSRTDELVLYADFSLTVEDRFSGNYLADECWYLSPTGLCFTFEPYEVGPYSAGIVTAEIPYSMLIGYLNDAYFPMERLGAQGTLIMESQEDAALDPFTSLIEVNVHPGEDAVVIQTQGLVYDIIIKTPEPNATVLFMADQLTPGSAIVLRCGTPNLKIYYAPDHETDPQVIPNK